MRISKKIISSALIIVITVLLITVGMSSMAFAVEENTNTFVANIATELPEDSITATAPTGTISLSKSSITLGVNESYTLSATIKDTNNSNRTVTWTTTNNSIVTVNNGKLTAKKVGTATINAVLENGSIAKCVVTVKKAPTSVNLNKTSITLGVGENFDLNSSLPSGCVAYSIKYSSDNTKIATVKSAGGLVTAKAIGTAKITATTYNGKTVTCNVTVKKAPTSINLNKTSITLGVGEKFDLNSSLPSGCGAYSIKYTANNSVADVKASGGIITANKVGTSKITATTYNGKKIDCTVTVKSAPKSISLNKTNLSVQKGKTYDLNSKVSSNSASYSVKYTSSNPKVATVKASGGIVTGSETGTATITATTFNGKKATCKVTVTKAKNYSEDDLFCLAAVIWQEAGSTYCSDTMQYYVGNVVLNRVASPEFPNTVRGVITSRGQYGTMYWNGVSIPTAKDPITQWAIERCYDKAKKLLEGYRPLPNNVVYQAGFVQGSGVYSCVDGMYFCYR